MTYGPYHRLKEWKEYASRLNGKRVSWSQLFTQLLDDVEEMSSTLNDVRKLNRLIDDLEIKKIEDGMKK